MLLYLIFQSNDHQFNHSPTAILKESVPKKKRGRPSKNPELEQQSDSNSNKVLSSDHSGRFKVQF